MLVGTPIGNLDDLSFRAAKRLSQADVVCCEDTRRTGRLFEHIRLVQSLYNGDTQPQGSSAQCSKPQDSSAQDDWCARPKFIRLDGHTEKSVIPQVLKLLKEGLTVAVVSDAGMPALCDPGRHLVAAAAEYLNDSNVTEITKSHFDVTKTTESELTAIPGPSAGVTALTLSGFQANRYVFEGFLPRKGKNRAARLASIALETRTVVLFESPYRLQRCLTELRSVCGDERKAVVVREATKMHEEIVRGSLKDLCLWAERKVLGEIVVVVEGVHNLKPTTTEKELIHALRTSLQAGMSRSESSAHVAETFGVPKRQVYELSITL